MATIGNINVPAQVPVGSFPVSTAFPFVTIVDPPIRTFEFRGTGDIKRTQRYLLGPGYRQWNFKRELDLTEYNNLLAFWETHFASAIPFTFNCPLDEGGSTETVTAVFASEPTVVDKVTGLVFLVEVRLVEVFTGTGPSYDIASTVERISDSALGDALTAGAQQLIKLVTIRPKRAGYPAIYLSDQLVTVGGITYLPRLLRWDGIGQVACGMPGVGTESDEVTLVFGNADRVMTLLTADAQLDQAYVQTSFYHVQSRILCNFWAGEIVVGGWASNTGPEFVVKCSDPIASPFIVAPPRTIDRTCNKMFNDGVECPFSTVGALDLANYPAADATSCDHGLLTPNGCYAHGMDRYFNGLYANPQLINIKDNSTGIWGFFRNMIVAASLINDSAYGHAIPIVVTDIEFPVNAIIVAARDESDFFDAVAVVGEGPMELTNRSTLNGQLNYNFPGPLGIRFIDGQDPATPFTSEPFPYHNIPVGGDFQMSPYDVPYKWSAGTCGIEMRVKDASGIQLTPADTHQLTAMVKTGWSGWVWGPSRYPGWSALGRADTKLPLTNPVWLAVNVMLLCKKLFNAPLADQEAAIDIPACMAAAAICDLQVDRLVELDQGQETQWKFIGALMAQKPLRDWLSDILLNCLGYYTFKDGKLSIGVRENGASTVAYTDGNVIWRSLNQQPLGPQFTRLVASFADREYNWVANSAVYQDDDYAVELGGGTRVQHRNAQMNLSGTADISPATRFVATRAREEIGGITADERKAGRIVTWRTTALGFDTSPGDVAAIFNEDMPGGVLAGGKVRVMRWKLLDDWSIELTGRTVTDSMYDLVQGPKPVDVRPGDIPGVGGSVTTGQVWRPDLVAAIPGDPIYDQYDRTFQVTQQYALLADGTTQATLQVQGQIPVNDPGVSTPPTVKIASQATTGGSLPGGRSIFVSICAVATGVIVIDDGHGGTIAVPQLTASANSVVEAFKTPADTDTNSIKLDGIKWPPPPATGPWTGYTLFGSLDHAETICMQVEGTVDGAGNLPTSLSLTGVAVAGPPSPPNPPDTMLHYATYGPPNVKIKKLRIKVRLMCHPGVSPGLVTEVVAGSGGGDGTIRCMHLASDRSQDTNPTEGGIAWGADAGILATDNWGPGDGRPQRILSILTHKSDGSSPLLNFLITGYNSTSGTFSCSPDPAAAGVGPGDVFVVRFSPNWDPTLQTFFDLGMINGQYPIGNPVPGVNVPANAPNRVGCIGRIIAGPGRGQTRKVIYYSPVSYLFDTPFVGVDQTSIVGIEYPAWVHTTDGPDIANSSILNQQAIPVVVSDLLEHGLIVQGVTVDSNGDESTDSLSPTRETFMFGDTAFGFGGLQLGARASFGRGDSGGGVAVQVGDESEIIAATYPGFLQGYDVVNEAPNTVGAATADLLKWDGAAYTSVLGGNLITIPTATSNKIVSATAFAKDLNLEVKVGDLFKVRWLSVGATPPTSPVVRIYWGTPTPVAINTSSGRSGS